MKIKKLIIPISIFVIISYSTYKIYKKFFLLEKKELYVTQTPQKRNIFQTIHATGTLEIKNNLKIGSLVSGTIKKIFVKENQRVKKNEKLALIDNGQADTQVKKAQGELEKAIADLEYAKSYFNRQEQLFKSEQISKDAFEQTTKDLKKTKANVKIRQADLELRTIEFNNKTILAPEDGIIVSIGVTEGQSVTTDLDATVLFILAKDITKMEAKLDIDESDIGQIKVGQKVKFTVGAYVDDVFKGNITEISYSAKLKNDILSYKAKIEVDNKDQKLRPGMTINAKINVSKCINCLAITSQAFQINKKILKKIAEKIGFKFLPLDKARKKELKKSNNGHYPIKYVWVVEDKNFIQKAIKVNVTDDNYFEIKDGLTQDDKVIIDIEENDEMKSLYEKIFKGAL